MVSMRSKIEARHPFNSKEVYDLLQLVSYHAVETHDLRFIDCITYFEELGFVLDKEDKF
jgi:hypothetical protein